MGWVFDWHGQDGRATGPLDVACTVTQTYGAGGNAPMVVDIVCRASTQGGAESQMNTATTLTTDHDRTIIAHRNESVCIQGSMIGRTDKNGPQGSGTNKGVCFNCIEDADEMEREQAALDACPTLPRMYFLKPLKPKAAVIQELGFPVLSKEIAGKISVLQNPTPKNATVRHVIITGETGEYGGFQTNSRMKLSQRWLEKFGGADEEGAQLGYEAAPFKVSDRCCYYLKEKPADIWAKVHNSAPYLGLMASEGGRREKSLMMHGCNYFGKSTVRSAPFAIFSRQDILQLALDLGVPVPEEYGEIARDVDGTLRTTLAQRTGCTMCGFGVHLEKRPNRFDRLRESNHKEWEFWMRHVCRDEDGNWYGWGRVLDYIGVEWENEPGQITGQLTFD